MNMRFDAIVIGAGQAGPSLAVRLANAGHKVAIVERKSFGGTCVNTGCMPTKALVASAYAAYLARRAADYGVTIDGEVRVDMNKVKARKDEIVQRASQGVEKWLRSTPNLTVLHGHARFTSPTTVQVNDESLEASKIFINVGGHAFIPPMPGVDDVPYLTNSSIMHLDVLPEHLVIVGGSYVGLEFAQAYRRFGARVTVAEMAPQIIGREDPDVSRACATSLPRKASRSRQAPNALPWRSGATRSRSACDCEGDMREAVGSHLLLAVGRTPNTDNLGLDKAGVRTDERGNVVVDDELRTSVPGIWAMGDCNGRGAFTHTAYNDFEVLASNLLDKASRTIKGRVPAYALFTDPPLGRVGMSDTEIKRSGRKALVGMRPMTRVSRAVEKGESLGFMKIAVDAESKRILGGTILGVGGDEAVHSILDVMALDAPYAALQQTMHIHPTVAELIPTLLSELKPMA